MRPGSPERIEYYCRRVDTGQPLFDDLPADLPSIPQLPIEAKRMQAGAQPHRPDPPRQSDSEPDSELELRMVEHVKRYGRTMANALAENMDADWQRTNRIVVASRRLEKCGGFVTLR